MTTYTVSTVSRDVDGNLVLSEPLGHYAQKTEAMRSAKKTARTRSDCVPYGPSSLAYVGPEITAVVAWQG